jgi:hypothetical protein
MLSGIGQDFEFTGMDIVPHLIERHRQVSHGPSTGVPLCVDVGVCVRACVHACRVCAVCV